MNKFYNMLSNVKLQNISSLFQVGSKKHETDGKNLEEREDHTVKVLEQRLEEVLPSELCKTVTDIAMEYANDCCEIYFTVGMKAGAKVLFQLLNDSINDN